MPNENQKRGRRGEKKRKHEADPDESNRQENSKRRKSMDVGEADEFIPVNQDFGNEDMSTAYPSEKAFFGMLDEEEQEYFKRADEMLELNSFGSPEERSLFLESVWKEADSKELKIAQSQSCSRLLERLIRNSTASQLKNLFQKFSGNLIHLLSHRFASHCCETLFTCAAPFVSDEVRAPTKKEDAKDTAHDVDEIYVSMENLFLHTLAELEGNLGFLLTDRFASHALRILLLVFAGKPITTQSMKSLLQGKGKEGVSTALAVKQDGELASQDRPVPQSFATALEKLIHDSVVGLDTDKLRALATHPNANPVLQLLLTLELTYYGKQRAKDESSIIRTLLPDDPLTADCQSAGFIGGMVFDPIGSHLVEKIIETAPGKMFKNLYNNYFKERLVTYAKHESGTYINCRILERLGEDDLLEAHEIICPVIPELLERQWTSLTRTLIERCTIRQIDTQAIAVQIDQTFQGPNGSFDVTKLLKVNHKPDGTNGDPQHIGTTAAGPFVRVTEPAKVHVNILAQAMLIVPGSLSALVLDSLLGLEPTTLVSMAQDHIITRTLQQALTTRNASMIQRRKLIQGFYGHIGEMALDKSASHVVDCIWEGTHGLAFIRERIAEELAENESALRESACGRAVWKNWKMDIYKRKRSEWVRQSKIKASNDGFQSFSELDAKKDENGTKKTPLQLARERHAQNKAKKENKDKKDSEGRNHSNRGAAGPAPAAAHTARAST